MYAVIKTGGKQYRVQPGDVLVVEKLDGEAGAEIAFNEVLMLGDGGEVTLGGPLIDGAVVRATLIETRKGDKVKVFKKIRRQGYRRTRGHRQIESVLRVTGLEGAGLSAKWDGEVDMTPRAVLNARARGLAASLEQVSTLKGKKAAAPKTVKVDHAATTAETKTAAKKAVKADVVDEQEAAELAPAKAQAAPKAAPKAPAKAKAAPAKTAPKADAAPKAAAAAPAAKKAAAKSDDAKAEPKKVAAKPKAAPKAKK